MILFHFHILLGFKIVLYVTSEDYLSDYRYFGWDFLIVDLIKQPTAKVKLKASSCSHSLLSWHTDSPPRLSWPALSESWPSQWPPVQLAYFSPLLSFSAPPPAFVSPSLQTSPSHCLWMDRKPTVGVYNGIKALLQRLSWISPKIKYSISLRFSHFTLPVILGTYDFSIFVGFTSSSSSLEARSSFICGGSDSCCEVSRFIQAQKPCWL